MGRLVERDVDQGSVRLTVLIQDDGDAVVALVELDSEEDVDSCSCLIAKEDHPHTFLALLVVCEAMKVDNAANPIEPHEPLEEMAGVYRLGDMSPCQFLRLEQVTDGRIRLHAEERRDVSGVSSAFVEVEYCTAGGRSPYTRNSLYRTFDAIKADNEENPI